MSIKSGSRDKKCLVLIQGEELFALQEVTYLMSESFGLDSRILNYKGKRPIGLYEWDFECILGGSDYFFRKGDDQYPTLTTDEKAALDRLHQRLDAVYKETYEST
ncbi:hypothetical protein [uncultured Thiodictyon sp.]|uniref:hypothetical protein n=1 Tax=uncultured Thiodictyon sp. TaxID=1846217 RepID=UPI0025EF0218|nr:hypothetical protein [uncultured Thiodictyon sp.]